MNSGVWAFLPVLALGLVAGVLSGMFGIGGGLVIVPALVFFFDMPLQKAVGTSLYALRWPVGLLGVAAYWRSGSLDVWRGSWIALGLFLAAWFGARLTLALPKEAMRQVYAVFLLVVGVYFLWGPSPSRKAE